MHQFSGSEHRYQRWLVPDFALSDGAKHLAETTKSQWLMEEIALAQRVSMAVEAQKSQVWKFVVSHDQSGQLTCEDGRGNTVYSKPTGYSVLPPGEIELCFENFTISLPGER